MSSPATLPSNAQVHDQLTDQNNGVNAAIIGGDVEQGLPLGDIIHADSPSSAHPVMPVQTLGQGNTNGEATEDPMMPEASRTRDQTVGDVRGELVSNHKLMSIKVDGNSIPTVVGVIGCLIQVVTVNRKFNSDQKILLKLCFVTSVATLFLGLPPFIFSSMLKDNPRRARIIKPLSMVARGVAFVDDIH